MRDGNKFEYKLQPSKPHDIIKNDINAKRSLSNFAQQNGFDIIHGTGHWHFSLMQDGTNLLSNNMQQHNSKSLSNKFTFAVIRGVLDMQSKFPAFFIKPKIAEMDFKASLSFTGPDSIYFDADIMSASVRAKDHRNGITTIEPRLASSGPYAPVYLYMLAIKNGLENFCNNNGYLHEVNEDIAMGTIYGEGGFEEIQNITRANLKDSDSPFPQNIANVLFDHSAALYEEYRGGNAVQNPENKQRPYERTRVLEPMC